VVGQFPMPYCDDFKFYVPFHRNPAPIADAM